MIALTDTPWSAFEEMCRDLEPRCLDILTGYLGTGVCTALQDLDVSARIIVGHERGDPTLPANQIAELDALCVDHDVRWLPALHAKLYVFGGRALAIGSANFTKHAFEMLDEILLVTDDVGAVAAAQAMFDARWSKAQPVEPSRLRPFPERTAGAGEPARSGLGVLDKRRRSGFGSPMATRATAPADDTPASAHEQPALSGPVAQDTYALALAILNGFGAASAGSDVVDESRPGAEEAQEFPEPNVVDAVMSRFNPSLVFHEGPARLRAHLQDISLVLTAYVAQSLFPFDTARRRRDAINAVNVAQCCGADVPEAEKTIAGWLSDAAPRSWYRTRRNRAYMLHADLAAVAIGLAPAYYRLSNVVTPTLSDHPEVSEMDDYVEALLHFLVERLDAADEQEVRQQVLGRWEALCSRLPTWMGWPLEADIVLWIARIVACRFGGRQVGEVGVFARSSYLRWTAARPAS